MRRDMLRRVDWPLVVVVLLNLVIVAAFGTYLTHRASVADHRQALSDQRQALANQRAETEREGFCSILDLIPTNAITRADGVETARSDYRCGPPRTPGVLVGAHPTKVIVKHHRTVIRRTVIVPGPTRTVTVHRHRTVSGHHTHRPGKRSHVTPAPTPTCALVVCLPNGKTPPGQLKHGH